MQIGAILKQIREQKNLTQVQVAKKMKVNQAQISRIESCTTELETATLKKICKVYGMPYQFVVWQSLEEKDISSAKLSAFKMLQTPMNNLISETLKLNSKQSKKVK